jgi:RNA polymerase sigma factor (sigma-70 family)
MPGDTPKDDSPETFSSMFGKYAEAVAANATDEEIQRRARKLVPFFEQKAKDLLRCMRFGSDDDYSRTDRFYHDRHDVMQNVFSRIISREKAPGLWEKAKRERGSNLNSYLTTALRNGMLSVFRHETAHHKRIVFEEPVAHDPAPEDGIVEEELQHKLRTALGLHKVDSLETYLLYLDTHDYEETSNRQGIKHATARKRVDRVRDTLEPILTKQNVKVTSFTMETLCHIITNMIAKKNESILLGSHSENTVRVNGTARTFNGFRNSDIPYENLPPLDQRFAT